ncbi:HAD family hydrolase [Micromonospora sp. NPDC126480]|uniref:HAD family hydrolase n=1 Tax=Micromonospora sp. NPDC126480 TaxID=3155312 RepID=UPI003333477D
MAGHPRHDAVLRGLGEYGAAATRSRSPAGRRTPDCGGYRRRGGRAGPAGTDCDAALHRETYHRVFADAGLDPALSEALYSVESDAAHNPFAADAAPVLREIAGHGVPIGVVSDIHYDARPAFAAASIADVVSAFVLSYEHGVQKPDPATFRRAADDLGVPPEQIPMVGERHGYDGGAVEVGMTTLLLPPLRDVREERLHLAARLLGVPVAPSSAP